MDAHCATGYASATDDDDEPADAPASLQAEGEAHLASCEPALPTAADDSNRAGHPDCSGCEGEGCPLCEGWEDVHDMLVCGAAEPADPRRTLLSDEAPQVDARAVGAAAILLTFVSVLVQPLVFAHANGFTVVGLELPERATRPSCLARAQRWVDAAIGASHLAYMIGEYVGGARVCAAPVDFAPPPDQVCRSPALVELLA